MKRLLLIFATTTSVGLAAGHEARAQQGLTASQAGSQQASSAEGSVTSAPTPGIHSNPGVKLSDEAVLHAGVGASAGYDSNVFFNDANKVTSPILEVTPAIDITNAPRDGTVPSSIYYDLAASLQYREYLSDDDNVKAQRSFNPSINGSLQTSKQTAIGLVLSDAFTRLQEPPYVPTTGNITRDYNLASAQIRVSPGGGRLSTTLGYSNSLQIFETTGLEYANVMGHELKLDISWKWLPKTAVFVQAAQDIITYLNTDAAHPRQNGYPFKAVAGLRGLVTAKLSALITAGYAIGNYQDGAPNPSGADNLIATADLNYAPTSTTMVGLGYRHEFQNSPVIGTFYDSDRGYIGIKQSIASRLIVGANGQYEYRRYKGYMLPRNDKVLGAGAIADFYIQQWFYAGVSYNLSFNDSNLTVMEGGVDYTKHLVMGRVGFVY
jgi:hypothetical protein